MTINKGKKNLTFEVELIDETLKTAAMFLILLYCYSLIITVAVSELPPSTLASDTTVQGEGWVAFYLQSKTLLHKSLL